MKYLNSSILLGPTRIKSFIHFTKINVKSAFQRYAVQCHPVDKIIPFTNIQLRVQISAGCVWPNGCLKSVVFFHMLQDKQDTICRIDNFKYFRWERVIVRCNVQMKLEQRELITYWWKIKENSSSFKKAVEMQPNQKLKRSRNLWR